MTTFEAIEQEIKLVEAKAFEHHACNVERIEELEKMFLSIADTLKCVKEYLRYKDIGPPTESKIVN